MVMRGTGFEPAQALSYSLLRAARLTTPTPPLSNVHEPFIALDASGLANLEIRDNLVYKKVLLCKIY